MPKFENIIKTITKTERKRNFLSHSRLFIYTYLYDYIKAHKLQKKNWFVFSLIRSLFFLIFSNFNSPIQTF
jgi:hypothetical protein